MPDGRSIIDDELDVETSVAIRLRLIANGLSDPADIATVNRYADDLDLPALRSLLKQSDKANHDLRVLAEIGGKAPANLTE